MQRPIPIFVLAPPRSCSSVFAACLGQHPACYGFPELELCGGGVTVQQLRANDARWDPEWATYFRSGLLRTIGQLVFCDQSEDGVAAAANWLDERCDWKGVMLMSYLFDLVAPKRAVEKSPGTVSSPDSLLRCLEAFPDAFCVHLTRDPMAMAMSWARHVSKGAAASDSGLIGRGLTLWLASHLRIRTLEDHLPASQYTRVRAEDFIAQPKVTLARCARRAGLESTEAAVDVMTHPEASVYAVPGPSTAPGGFDATFLHRPQLSAPLLNFPVVDVSEIPIDEERIAKVDQLCEIFGYSTLSRAL